MAGTVEPIDTPIPCKHPKKLTMLCLMIILGVCMPYGAPSTALADSAILRPIIFPVDGKSTFYDDFNDPRQGGKRVHHATDILAAKMTPILSPVDGIVYKVEIPEPSWGYEISIKDAEGYRYNFVHINNDTPGTDDGKGGVEHAYAPGIVKNAAVVKGQLIGWVGDSGNAEHTTPHLHFEIYSPAGVPINPFASLTIAKLSKDLPIADVQKAISETAVAEVAAPKEVVDLKSYTFTEKLELGDKGEAVIELQKKLQELGYLQTKTATNYYGKLTKAAVMKFQKAQKLPPVGVVGPKTLAVLNKLETKSTTSNQVSLQSTKSNLN